VSEKLTWRALDEGGEARTAANRPAFLPQTPAPSRQTFFWPCNLPYERYDFREPVPKKEIPAKNLTTVREASNDFEGLMSLSRPD
jgi:hypothetical protein